MGGGILLYNYKATNLIDTLPHIPALFMMSLIQTSGQKWHHPLSCFHGFQTFILKNQNQTLSEGEKVDNYFVPLIWMFLHISAPLIVIITMDISMAHDP